ncbi:hypothetical protein DFR86_07540 [Acidianus sulfidivorans JP7]|uniref:FAD-binding FR-type domain-containing protein n=1 Tax=Acidianus sulfidivorans JP7 TaxID=619593 RepID=A0A2U9IN35_9CREN|nr:FAD-dependent oxidoreductase [Acidianus sulfidivorans]AWR97415.1 hypothetical protein DFR86_07540 [Acidianus sulfidivorans JP7]
MARIISKNRIGDILIVKFDQKLQFKPGNTIDVIIDKDRRTFSIASTTWEDFLMIATKITNSPFKQKLATMKEGDEVSIEGPFEDEFVIKDSSSHVFVAKGIGITPVRSMALYLARNNKDVKIFYQPDEDNIIPFKDHLQGLLNISTITEKIFLENKDAMFYISGTPEFTKNATKFAITANIKPGKFVVEPFTGY